MSICHAPCSIDAEWHALLLMLCCVNAQTAGGSVLGRMVIALAKRSGVKTINVVRRSAQKQELLDIG